MNATPRRNLTVVLLVVLAGTATVAQGVTVAREETRGNERFMVLENNSARIEVLPAAGAAITSYLDKRSGIDFVVGAVTPGTAIYGWADYTHLHPNDLFNKWVGALPHQAAFVKGSTYEAIVATCEVDHVRMRREMRLDNDSPQLTVLCSLTNLATTPRGVWLRWHPYIKLDDEFAHTSSIVVPGADATEVRQIPIGAGWDNHFMNVPGYWLAANYKTGNGLWMTFRKEQAAVAATWTDSKFSDHPRRGWFAAELMPKPTLLQPGAATSIETNYLPLTAQDRPETIDLGLVAEADRANARRFLQLVRPNLPVIAEHTMAQVETTGPGSGEQQNIFPMMHRRRDRFALLDWGIADAMMSVPTVQSQMVRARLYAHLFEKETEPHDVIFRLSVTDNSEREVLRQQWATTVTPEKRLADHKELISIQKLADGWYTFTLSTLLPDRERPIHVYTERRKLGGSLRAQMAQARKLHSKPLAERERPFVRALRQIALPSPEDSRLRIPIGIEEAAGVARRAWPVRVGVPFAPGRLASTDRVAVLAPNGKPVPAQLRSMGTWRDGSLKWLLVEFPADVPANSHVFYTLATEQSTKGLLSPILRQDGARIEADTGIRKFRFAPGGKFLGFFGDSDLWWETGSGRRFEFRLQGDEAGITVEENGPLRGVIKAVGWYYEAGKPGGQAIARGELRLEFYRGQPFQRLYHTVTYAGDPWNDTLGSYGIRFRLPGAAREVALELDGKTYARPGRINLLQVDENLAVAKSGDAAMATGKRASGAICARGGSGSVSILHRDLWRMYPKKMEADARDGTITYHYWPTEAHPMDWRPREDSWISDSASINTLGVGASRTHEFIIDESGQPLTQLAAEAEEPVLAVVPPRYLCATGALLHLQPYDPARVLELEEQISETFDSYLLQQELHGWYGEWKWGALPNSYLKAEERWADYGRYPYILNEQDICHVPWLAFLRSGDRTYFKFAEANTRHLLEVATIRLEPVWPQTVGMSHRHQDPIWLGAGDYGHSMLDPFLEMYHVTGYRPAWEAAERMAHGMAEQRDGSWRYISNPIAGLARMYLETGEPFYKEQADRLWRELCAPDRNDWWLLDHGNRMVLYYSQLNDECRKLWEEWTAGKEKRFQGLDVLAALYQRTGDRKYADAALQLFKTYQKQAREYDFEREDPLRWSIATHTQHVLVHVREMCYASAVLAAAQGQKTP